MLVELLAVASFSAAPQQPVADTLADALERVDAMEPVIALEERLAGLRPARLRSVQQPAAVGALRRAGLAVADRASTWGALPDDDADTDRIALLFGMAREAWGFQGRAPRVPPRPSIDDLIDVAERVHRDMKSTLGSGRRLEDVAAWMLTTVDELREHRENLGDLDRDDEEELAERFARLAEVDQKMLLAQAEELVQIACALDRPDLLQQWRAKSARSPRSDGYVQGDVLVDRDSGLGRIVVGGFGRNVYDSSQVALIIDLGGDDLYTGPAGGANERRELALVVDLGGDDTYEAIGEGLGAAIYGIGVLVDCKGDDSYSAETRSVGFGAAGVGVMVDLDGADEYALGDQSGGVSLAGTGIWYDAAGDDRQVAGVQSFGVGLPGGVAIGWDRAGDDERRLARERKRLVDAAAQTTSTDLGEEISVGLGVGVGVLPRLAGGFGAFVDEAGDDDYQTGGLSCGIGVRGGVGLFQDRGGDDHYEALDGAFGVGYGAGVGMFVDTGGDDVYAARRLAYGGGTLDGVGVFIDRVGTDEYTAVWPAHGVGRRGGLGLFLERGGIDTFTLAASPKEWRLAIEGEAAGIGIGLFYDDGDLDDEYRFTGLEAPERGTPRVDARGEGAATEKQVFVVR